MDEDIEGEFKPRMDERKVAMPSGRELLFLLPLLIPGVGFALIMWFNRRRRPEGK